MCPVTYLYEPYFINWISNVERLYSQSTRKLKNISNNYLSLTAVLCKDRNDAE